MGLYTESHRNLNSRAKHVCSRDTKSYPFTQYNLIVTMLAHTAQCYMFCDITETQRGACATKATTFLQATITPPILKDLSENHPPWRSTNAFPVAGQCRKRTPQQSRHTQPSNVPQAGFEPAFSKLYSVKLLRHSAIQHTDGKANDRD